MNRFPKSKRLAVSTLAAVSLFVIALIIGGGIVGMLMGASAQNQSSTKSAQTTSTATANTSGVYKLTLAITVNNSYNSTTSGPRYWVVAPSGLETSANISLPAFTKIELTIIDYDSASPLPSQWAQVAGTISNRVYVINGTTAASENINLTAVEAVSSLDPNTQIAHTFTVPQIGLSIPVAANSVEVANFYINQTGTFLWHCEDPCGYGPSGWEGPMSTPGWMEGNITVS
ncbi:MAG: hypothetical protein JRN15_00045 [Nitrososphaerota archaeon]|nr:hypothetical protein [Nitrososphaerota archaeon]